MELRINGIEVDCVIGERPDERVRLQRILIDARLEVADTAAETDDLSDAVDYVALANAVRTRLVEAQCKMIERAARLAAEACLGFAGVRSAEVAVTKSGAVPGIASARAVFTARRTENGRGDHPQSPAAEQKEGKGCPQRKPWWRF